MMKVGEKKSSSSYWLYCCCTKGIPGPSKLEMEPEVKQGDADNCDAGSNCAKPVRPGGWRAMPYILGNETFERLGTYGLPSNFTVYFTRVFHMEPASAANLLNIWIGTTNFAPLLGAFISDAYLGRFKTIAFASFVSLVGMVIVTLTAGLPNLHPPKCDPKSQISSPCKNATSTQLGILIMGLGFMSIGTGGIRPCSIPFGVDQFDQRTEEGIKGINSFFNWYYTTFTVVLLIATTVVVYIQDSISWTIGFGIPTVLMVGSIALFFVGTRVYVHVRPEGSIFSSISRVFVAAYKKRQLKLPGDGEAVGVYYDPPLKETILSKLPLTNEFRSMNKAAMIETDDLNPDGSLANPWRLCSIQQVEEVKCLIRIIPIWAAGIVALTSLSQGGSFLVSQALIMDRHLGPKFQVPAGSMGVISLITIGLWLPFYDRIIVPAVQKITKHDGGITLLQRIGIGIVISISSMIVAGLVEKERRATAISHPNAKPKSAMWLAPQLVLMGLCEAFNIIGQIEFFNRQFPDHMKSIGNALFSCSFGGANYLSSLVITIVKRVTKTSHHQDWLAKDLNAGKLDYFYYLIAGMGFLNLLYFLLVASRYHYKGSVQMGDKYDDDLELSSIKVPNVVDKSTN